MVSHAHTVSFLPEGELVPYPFDAEASAVSTIQWRSSVIQPVFTVPAPFSYSRMWFLTKARVALSIPALSLKNWVGHFA